MRRKHLGRIVEFVGHKSKQECSRIMWESDIFVLPSVSEGLPLALLEAMANRCACIVTNIGLPVKDKKDALVVEAKNPGELKNAIELLVGDKKLRDELGRNAFEKVKKDYSWEKAVEKYLGLVSGLRVV